MPNSIASMSNFLLLQQSQQNKLDNLPLNCPSALASATTIVVASNAANSTAAGLLQGPTILNHTTGLLSNPNNSMHSAYSPLNFTNQQSTPPLSSLNSSTASSLAITAPLHNQATNPYVHLSQLNNQQQQQYSTSSNYFYSTLQPANRRVRLISNNLNGLTTIDDLHMHTDV